MKASFVAIDSRAYRRAQSTTSIFFARTTCSASGMQVLSPVNQNFAMSVCSAVRLVLLMLPSSDCDAASPIDPDMARFQGAIAIAHYTARRFDEPVRYTRENLRLCPGFQGAQRLHAASLAQSGRIGEARAFLSIVRRTHKPPLTIDWVRKYVPYQTPELIELFIAGLRKAGLRD